MSEPIRQKINTNLEQAKGKGKLRVENIREIVRDAVSQTISELKEGTGEIGLIVKDAASAMIADLKGRGQHGPEEITASIQGAIEGGIHQRQQEIDRQRAKLQEIQAQIDEQQKQLDREVGIVLINIDANAPEDSMKSAVGQAVSTVRESHDSVKFQQQYLKLKSQLESLDEKLLARYGDRYGEVKHQWENAKTWYHKTKTEAETSETLPLQQKQSKLESDLGDLGTVIARKEHEVKEQLKSTLQTLWQGRQAKH
ncbi:hypothetical protein V2H45_21295 [Tumidithrix elongata RA019]|uniref:Histidine kinase n=1 Tax=Tumidithrix elongata BACA0141 TaxID=2716417 RepID=A0AAW9Q432_9CYAN|nr:hypothetical protein [Tumidithrix elongata RA019]